MVVLVIVVGCFAVLWPRILSPLVLGGGQDSVKPNHFDREAGKGGIYNSSSTLNVNIAAAAVRRGFSLDKLFATFLPGRYLSI